ncbi:MAG: TIGR03089 family protein [Cellulomonas sp.]
MKNPSSVADVLALLTRDPGRPRLTWYGPQSERIELSGAVLANWVSKTTNLLVEEFDAGPGVRIGLDLPAHWRTVVWALAAWRCGACVVVGDSVAAAEVVVTDQPGLFPGVDQLVAVALPGLARRFDGELPAGAVDAASAVMTYGDQVGWAPEVVGGEVAVEGVLHDGLVEWAVEGANTAEGARVLLESGGDRVSSVPAALRGVLGVWARDGSVVLLGHDVVDALALDAARRERLIASERVTSGV